MTRKRKERRRPSSIEAARQERGVEPQDDRTDADPSSALHSEERQHLVQEALSQLGDDYRTAIILKEIDGLRYEEIADIVGCPIGTVRSRIHRARHELREKLGRAIQNEL
jgi:RNA polymerase sigma-70 factor (ECF subfamily)